MKVVSVTFHIRHAASQILVTRQRIRNKKILHLATLHFTNYAGQKIHYRIVDLRVTTIFEKKVMTARGPLFFSVLIFSLLVYVGHLYDLQGLFSEIDNLCRVNCN